MNLEILISWATGAYDSAYHQAKEGVRLYGAEPYMGATFQATLAALCDDDELAESAIVAGQDLLRQGSAAHNHVDFARYGSAYYWRQGNKTRANSIVEQVQRQFGNEPVGQLDAILSWMNQESLGSKSSTEDAREQLQQQALGFLAVTHPYPVHQLSAGVSSNTVSTES